MSLITAVVSLSASYLFMMDSGVQERDVTLYNQEVWDLVTSPEKSI